LSLEEYEEAVRIASITSNSGKISNDSVAALEKACLFTRINECKNSRHGTEILLMIRRRQATD